MKTPRARGHWACLARWLTDNRGVAAIEFAILAPMMFILIFGTVEIALDMMADASVQFAAQQASRAGLVVETPTGESRATQAQNIVNSVLSTWISLGATVAITEVDYGSYNNLGSSNFQPGQGGLSDVVSYNISLTTPGFSGIPQILGISSLNFQRNYLVQNE